MRWFFIEVAAEYKSQHKRSQHFYARAFARIAPDRAFAPFLRSAFLYIMLQQILVGPRFAFGENPLAVVFKSPTAPFIVVNPIPLGSGSLGRGEWRCTMLLGNPQKVILHLRRQWRDSP